ncbi:MAG: hypothetical protein GY804_01410 [Alphaproteobacteria bacterium]|nr:hypothetical protein [Alphaproteobacteria bacterium]
MSGVNGDKSAELSEEVWAQCSGGQLTSEETAAAAEFAAKQNGVNGVPLGLRKGNGKSYKKPVPAAELFGGKRR